MTYLHYLHTFIKQILNIHINEYTSLFTDFPHTQTHTYTHSHSRTRKYNHKLMYITTLTNIDE